MEIIMGEANPSDDKSALGQVMATSHYLSQYWRRSLSPFGVTRPQRWFNTYFYNVVFCVIPGALVTCVTPINRD